MLSAHEIKFAVAVGGVREHVSCTYDVHTEIKEFLNFSDKLREKWTRGSKIPKIAYVICP